MVPLKYLSSFWRTLEMTLINCEINLIITWYANCFIIDGFVNNQVPTFVLTDTKMYAPVVTLWTQDTEKLLQQLKLGFKTKTGIIFRYLDYLIDPSFQGVNKLFVLSFEYNTGRTS